MHGALKQQLARFFGAAESVPPEWQGFIAAVDDAYDALDADRLVLERSLKLSSEELAQAKYEMRAIFQVFPDLFFRLDAQGRILQFTGGSTDLIRKPGRFLGNRMGDVMPPAVADLFEEAIHRVRTTRSIVRVEYPMKVEGREKVFEARLLPLPHDQIIAIVRDITERVQAAHELARSLSLLRATLESTTDGILVVDRDGAIVDFNLRFLQMWGIPPEIVASKDDRKAIAYVLDQLVEPDAFLEKVRELYAHPDAESYDSIQFKDGRIFERYSKPQKIGGECVGRVWSFRDVTNRRRAEEELSAQRSFLRQVIDVDPNFVFAKDRKGRFTLVNRAVAEAYGTTVENLLGKTDADFNSNPEEVEHFRRDDLEVMDTRQEKVILEEIVTDSSGKQRFFQTIKRPIVSGDGTADQVLGVATDITERKKLEEQLLQSQKMEAIGLLAGGVAHDFNNLLAIITGYAELASQKLEDNHPAHESLAKLQRAALRSADLTRKLLAFSRRQVLQVKLYNLNEVLEDFSKLLARIVGEDVEVQIRKSAGPLIVKADAGQLEQMLLNLCTNARQAMPKGGQLFIEMRSVTLDEGFVAGHPGARFGEHVHLSVTDTGIGMDANTLDRIFEPFFTTKGDGTGLGLSTVYGIVQQHQGYLSVRSAVGHGTSFHVYLPLSPVEDVTQDEEVEVLPRGGSETILLAEDEPTLRDLLEEGLADLGYAVIATENGEDALRVFEARRNQIDLVILDVVMPKLAGPDAFLRMKALTPAVKVIFISGYAPDSDRLAEMIEREGLPFLPKPFSLSALAVKIREVINSRACDSSRSGARSRNPAL